MNTERPILFSGTMVRAILDGRKTQTRRVINPQPERVSVPEEGFIQCTDEGIVYGRQRIMCGGIGYDPEIDVIEEAFPNCESPMPCPYGGPGGRLWVRETWADPNGDRSPRYKATWPVGMQQPAWRPSIHMPRWASRITLEIVSVRVERVQDISGWDSQAEGVDHCDTPGHDDCFYGLSGQGYKCSFERIWDSINAKRGYGWQVNPYVWAITFKVVQ